MDNKSSFSDLRHEEWDVVVLGAGVAGASVAGLAAKQGLSVLLAEAQPFPREKACGGCLNSRALASLTRLGIIEQVEPCGVPIHDFWIHCNASVSRWPISKMLSIRRSTLDAVLVQHAIKQGVTFFDACKGTILPSNCSQGSSRQVKLTHAGNGSQEWYRTVSAKVVMVASGLVRSGLTRSESWPAHVDLQARIGVQSLLTHDDLGNAFRHNLWNHRTDPAVLHMFVGQGGYVGVCGTDGPYVDFAAALDPGLIQKHKSIGKCIQNILDENGMTPIPMLQDVPWISTPRLTRQSKIVACQRVYLIGDAMGYVEPFTGEGMSWALASAEAIAPLLRQVGHAPSELDRQRRWNRWAVQHRKYQQFVCRWVAKQSRRPQTAGWVLRACDWLRPLRTFLLRKAMQ